MAWKSVKFVVVNKQTDNGSYKSPYRRGADNGIIMGIWLSAMFLLWSYVLYSPAVSGWGAILALALMVGVPFLLFFMLRRTLRVEGPVRATLSSLWVEGIMTFIFGCVIAVVLGYVFMRVIEPTFLNDLYLRMLEALNEAAKTAGGEAGEEYRLIASNLKGMMERGELPNALELLVNTMWFVTFSGCILSLIIAAIARAIGIKKK